MNRLRFLAPAKGGWSLAIAPGSLAHALSYVALVDPHSVSASPSHLSPPIDGVEERRHAFAVNARPATLPSFPS
ncbi:exported hypothetical protein [Mesorhizobium sp. SOD10]|nr:exported hypothetical protein [Mesorhizobium sp. SOD10]